METPGQDEPARATTLPPWIRPVRKKASSLVRSNPSSESPPQHSSPEAFSPSDFFAEPANASSVFPNTTTTTSSSTSQLSSMPSSPPYVNGASQTQTNNSTYMDTSGDNNMGMDMLREDPQMYMFNPGGEMMGLFNDGIGDVGHVFSSVEFMQQQHQNERQGIGSDGGFASPVFLKMNGRVNS